MMLYKMNPFLAILWISNTEDKDFFRALTIFLVEADRPFCLSRYKSKILFLSSPSLLSKI